MAKKKQQEPITESLFDFCETEQIQQVSFKEENSNNTNSASEPEKASEEQEEPAQEKNSNPSLSSGTYTNPNSQGKDLPVTLFKTLGKSSVGSWQELFAGYTSLKAITYSSSIGMSKQVVKIVNNVEIIFGNESILGSIKDIIAAQYATVKTLQEENFKNNNILIDKIEQDKLSLFVTSIDAHTSHQKNYLLSDEKNNFRTIVGSANLSLKAFGSTGNQLETIMVSDDFDTYDLFLSIYLKTKELSSQNLTVKNIRELKLATTENLPFFQQIKDQKIIEIMTPPKEEIFYTVQKDEFNKFVEKNNINPEDLLEKKSNKVLITYTKTKEFSQKINIAADQTRRTYETYPDFYIDKYKPKAYYKGNPIDTSDIPKDKFAKDIEIFVKYFQGFFEKQPPFQGNVKTNIDKYYATVNYAFCAPFLPLCRHETIGTSMQVFPYPLFLILKGTTNSGKSSLMKFILKLMFNQFHPKIEGEGGLIQKAEDKENAPAALKQKLEFTKGFPIMIDELSPKRWQEYSAKFIKHDSTSQFWSPMIMATNDVKEIDEALSKRTITFEINMFTNRMSNLQRKLFENDLDMLSGCLYKEYLKRMLVLLPGFLKTIHSSDKDAPIPDILLLSSKVLLSILSEHIDIKKYPYIKEYDIQYYLIKANLDQNILDFIDLYSKIGDEWEINKKLDYIKIKFEDQYKARNFQRKYGIEFTTLEGRYIIMPLKKTEKFFHIKIGKKNLLDSLKFWE